MHGIVIHEGSVTLKVEFAECEDTKCQKRYSEDQAQQWVWSTTALCNAAHTYTEIYGPNAQKQPL